MKSANQTLEQLAHRGYLIRWSALSLINPNGQRVWVEKDGHLICWAGTIEQARAEINNLLTVNVCAWCPDKDARTAEAQTKGLTVTHGICPACAVKAKEAL